MTSKISPILDHVHLKTVHLERALAFYRAVFTALGRGADLRGGREWLELDGFYIDMADEGAAGSHVHVGFIAGSQEKVRAFHAAGLAAGGRDNGPPGFRDYRPGYYAAYLLDPDGNNVEAVFDDRDS